MVADPGACCHRRSSILKWQLQATRRRGGSVVRRRDWYIGVGIVALAGILLGAFPRYEWRNGPNNSLLRADRWRGKLETGRFVQGQWTADVVRWQRQMDASEKRSGNPESASKVD